MRISWPAIRSRYARFPPSTYWRRCSGATRPARRGADDAAGVVVVRLLVQRTVNVGNDLEREGAELVVFAADDRDQRAVAHAVRARQVGGRLVADDHRAGASRDVARVERVIRMSVGDDDVVGLLHVLVDERRVGRVQRGLRDLRCGPRGGPSCELREKRVDEDDGLAVGDLEAGVAEVGEADFAGLEWRGGRGGPGRGLGADGESERRGQQGGDGYRGEGSHGVTGEGRVIRRAKSRRPVTGTRASVGILALAGHKRHRLRVCHHLPITHVPSRARDAGIGIPPERRATDAATWGGARHDALNVIAPGRDRHDQIIAKAILPPLAASTPTPAPLPAYPACSTPAATAATPPARWRRAAPHRTSTPRTP